MARRKSNAEGPHKRRPGWLRAARELGCTYSHLRRVLLGERESKSLLARYEALKIRRYGDELMTVFAETTKRKR